MSFDEAARFDAGDLAGVAASGRDVCWQTWAARAVLQLPGDARERLRDWSDPAARFWGAAADFVAGRDGDARRALQGLDRPDARRLASWLDRPRIEVLAQLPWVGQGSWDILGAARADRRFRIRNACAEPRAADLPATASVRDWLDEGPRPDLYVCQMLEWHILPPDLHELPCPVVAQTGDFDLHMHALLPWLESVDHFLVSGPSERDALRGLCERPVSTFPKCFGLIPGELPPVPTGARDIDVLQSGTLAHPYHRDKVARLHEVLARPGLRTELIEGFVSQKAYLDLLGRARLSYACIRHATTLPTRALDALAMGCGVVVQRDSVLRLYADDRCGVYEYGPEPDALGRAVEALLREPEAVTAAARRGASVVRQAFDIRRVGTEWLRFATVLAAGCEPARRSRRGPAPLPRSMIVWRGWALSGGKTELLDSTSADVAQALEARGDARAAIEATRERAIRYAARLRDSGGWDVRPAERAELMRAFDVAVARHPRSLVLRFNAVRCRLHWGNALERGGARRELREILDTPSERWDIDPRDDVMPWDFFSSTFDYRSYLDHANGDLAGEGDRRPALIDAIRASLHHYLGIWEDDRDTLARAVELAPDFAIYRWSHALAGLRSGLAEAQHDALEALLDLGERSELWLDAHALLDELRGRGVPLGARMRALDARVAATERISPRGSFLDADADLLPARRDARLLRQRAASEPDGRIAVLLEVPPDDEAQVAPALEDLARQSVAAELDVRVVLERRPARCPGARPSLAERARAWSEFGSRFASFGVHAIEGDCARFALLEEIVQSCSSQFLSLQNAFDRLRPDALEALRAALDARPDFAGAYGDAHVSAVAPGEEAAGDPKPERFARPDFAPQHLLELPFMGPQAVWRRSFHERWRGFDPGLDAHGVWDLWGRGSEGDAFLHVPRILGTIFDPPRRWGVRDRERERAEVKHVIEHLLELRRRRAEERRAELFPSPRASGGLLLVEQDDFAPDAMRALERDLDALRAELDPALDLRLRVVSGSDAADAEGAVRPPRQTLTEALDDATTWLYETVAIARGGLGDRGAVARALAAPPSAAVSRFETGPGATLTCVGTEAVLDRAPREAAQPTSGDPVERLRAALGEPEAPAPVAAPRPAPQPRRRVPGRGARILFVQQEWPGEFQRSTQWSYVSSLGYVEALRNVGAEVTWLPSAWLDLAPELFGDFDQIWLNDLVHLELPAAFVEWMQRAAPLRVGLVGESLQYAADEVRDWPEYGRRAERVRERARLLTHALPIDEADVSLLRDAGLAATWNPAAMPRAFVLEDDPSTRAGPCGFIGAMYPRRMRFFERARVGGRVVALRPRDRGPEVERRWQALDGLRARADQEPGKAAEYAARHAAERLELGREIFQSYLAALDGLAATLSPPALVKSFPGRVFEAAGRGVPVVAWRVPGRPGVARLFEPEREILLFDEDAEPEQLHGLLDELASDTGRRRSLARAAHRRVLADHTLEARVRRALRFVGR